MARTVSPGHMSVLRRHEAWVGVGVGEMRFQILNWEKPRWRVEFCLKLKAKTPCNI